MCFLLRSSGVLDYLHAVATTRAAPYISTIENGLQSIADDVTNAASDIFETYGEGALNALATKFKGVSDVKNTLKVFRCYYLFYEYSKRAFCRCLLIFELHAVLFQLAKPTIRSRYAHTPFRTE